MKISKDEVDKRVNKLLGEIYGLRRKLFSHQACGTILRNQEMIEDQIETKKKILLRLFEYRDLGIELNEKVD